MAHDVQTSQAIDSRWTKLTWDDLEEAFGGRTLAKGKSYRGRVDELVQDGRRLLARSRHQHGSRINRKSGRGRHNKCPPP